MDQEVALRDTLMWIIGIALALLAAGMMIWSEVTVAPLIVLGTLGILCIAVGAGGRRGQSH